MKDKDLLEKIIWVIVLWFSAILLWMLLFVNLSCKGLYYESQTTIKRKLYEVRRDSTANETEKQGSQGIIYE